jgi:hypothetical protein
MLRDVRKMQNFYNRKMSMKTVSLALPEAPHARPSIPRAVSFRFLVRTLVPLGTICVLLLLNACTSNSEKPAESKPAPKTTETISGRSGFQKLYIAARGWNADAKPYRLESSVTSDANGRDGKAAIWRASFASPAMRSEKTYTWSGSTAEGAPEQGVNPGIEDSYSASNASTQVFDMAFLKIDSDQALDTAQKHGGDKILAKDPNTPVFYVCDWNHNTNELVWHVIYGASRDDAKLTVSVNASTGEFIRVEK